MKISRAHLKYQRRPCPVTSRDTHIATSCFGEFIKCQSIGFTFFPLFALSLSLSRFFSLCIIFTTSSIFSFSFALSFMSSLSFSSAFLYSSNLFFRFFVFYFRAGKKDCNRPRRLRGHRSKVTSLTSFSRRVFDTARSAVDTECM